MKTDSIAEVGIPLCYTHKSIHGASPFNYESLINRDVNMKWSLKVCLLLNFIFW